MTLRIIGYWRNDSNPQYPDPRDMVDLTWDEGLRDDVAHYLANGMHLRGCMGLSPCRICGSANGSGELTDGVLVWPEGLAHYLRDHSVRLPPAIEEFILRRVEAMESPQTSTDWWTQGAPDPVSIGQPPLEALERLVWAGNAQLVRDPRQRFPGLLVQGDTVHRLVSTGEAQALVNTYEALMASVGQTTLPNDQP